MGDWCTSQHGKSGLTERVKQSTVNEAQAEAETIVFLKQYVPAGKSPMCGNTICQDRRFMVRGMPKLEAFFHYRNLDVSTLKPGIYFIHINSKQMSQYKLKFVKN